jgi:hypothetical protein
VAHARAQAFAATSHAGWARHTSAIGNLRLVIQKGVYQQDEARYYRRAQRVSTEIHIFFFLI